MIAFRQLQIVKSLINKSRNYSRNYETVFASENVQQLLSDISDWDLNKVFKTKFVKELESPQYSLLTDEQLNEFKDKARLKAKEKLQIPPYKNSWDLKKEQNLLSNDNLIANFVKENVSYVFTDITLNKLKSERVVAIREPNGVLRLAENEERDKVLNIYFPEPGKMYNMPKMFEDDYLEEILNKGRYEYVLDRACIQFEPDDPNYIRVRNRTFEHNNENFKFESLFATRHFGSLVFYLVINKIIDNLLLELMKQKLTNQSEILVKLYHFIHPDSKSALEVKNKGLENVMDQLKMYIEIDSQDSKAFDSQLI